MFENNFSKWTHWNERNNLDGIGNPGIYCIAVIEEDISEQPFSWIDKIEYIGMTNSKSGLKGRLKQFDDTIKDKKIRHGGADRFLYKHQNYNEVLNKLFVAVRYFECNVDEESNSHNDLLIMGDVVKQNSNVLLSLRKDMDNYRYLIESPMQKNIV